MACGGSLWIVAVFATAILILIQWLLHRKIFRSKKLFSIKIVFVQIADEREKIKQIFDIDRYNRLIVKREGADLIYHAILVTADEYSSTQLDEIMRNNKYILSIERCDEGY